MVLVTVPCRMGLVMYAWPREYLLSFLEQYTRDGHAPTVH